MNILVRLRVKYLLLLSDFNQTRISSTDFSKIVSYQISLNPSRGNLVVPCGQTDGNRDMTKLVVAFRNSKKAPKKISAIWS